MDIYDVINIYGPLVASLIAVIVAAVMLYKTHKRRQEFSKNNTAKRKPSSSKAYHKQEMPAPISKSQFEQKESPSKNSLEQKPSAMTTCPTCKMRVFPKPDGTCPSCQARISS